MDDVRVGRIARALRLRKGLRQVDLAARTALSQTTISALERGHCATLSLHAIRRVFGVLEARFEGDVLWRGGAIDRLIDERHATLLGAFARVLQNLEWDVKVEVTFSSYGERGSIDILAIRPTSQVGLVVGIKTELTSVESTVRRLDVRSRLADAVVRERFGVRPRLVGRLLVLEARTGNRRRTTRHATALDHAFPDRGSVVRSWLRAPVGAMSGLQFLAIAGGRAPERGRFSERDRSRARSVLADDRMGGR